MAFGLGLILNKMEILKNYINGAWTTSRESDVIDVINPANQEMMGKVPYGQENSRRRECSS